MQLPPTLVKSAVLPKTTSLCSSITVITLWSDGGRIIDNLQIDNLQIDNPQNDNLTNIRQIDNRQIDNLQIDNRQIDNLTFSKIDSAIPLPCPRGLGN